MTLAISNTHQGREGAKARRRAVALIGVVVIALIVILYFAFSAYLADTLSQTVRKPLTSTPADYGAAYENVQFESAVDHIPLRGWFIGTGGHKTILVLHAKDGRRDDPEVGLPDVDRALVQNGYDVFTFDFRGHGESGGSHFGLASLEVRDVGGALAYLRTRGIDGVGVIGFSMGAATALNSAAEYPAMRAVVEDSAFADLQTRLDADFTPDSGLPGIFIPGMEFMSWAMYGTDVANDKPARAVARMGNRPLLLIHGTADAYVPVADAYTLQQAGANDPNLELWIVPGAEHVRAFKQFPDEFLRRVLAFFKTYLELLTE